MPTDTTPPVPLHLAFSGLGGMLTWTETGSPPVLLAHIGLYYDGTNYIVSPNYTGDSRLIGTYVPCTGATATWGGQTQYTNGTVFLSYDSGHAHWIFATSSNSSSPVSLYFNNNSGPSTLLQNGWLLQGGAAPGPDDFGSNQGLTITGLSGIPSTVTVSNVVASGTDVTFTLSRMIASSETGGTFTVAAGAVTDSASPPNACAAASISITSANFGGGGTPRRRPVIAG